MLAEALAAGGFAVEPAALHASLVAVRPSLIRVSADPVSYPLHIVLRFELELALIEGGLDVADLPAAWNDGMRRLLGIEVPDDAAGVLQDTHWAAGAFGYFPSYALGCLIAAQLWEALERDLGPQDEALAARRRHRDPRLARPEHVHAHGRRLDTEPLVEHATGRGMEAGPFLRHARSLGRASVVAPANVNGGWVGRVRGRPARGSETFDPAYSRANGPHLAREPAEPTPVRCPPFKRTAATDPARCASRRRPLTARTSAPARAPAAARGPSRAAPPTGAGPWPTGAGRRCRTPRAPAP